MRAGELIAAVDALRPNPYSTGQKLRWLALLDQKLESEVLSVYEEVDANRSPDYGEETALLAPFPYDWELYTNWLFAQIDLMNAEIVKYNQSMTLFAAAWRQLADAMNRRHAVKNRGAWRL